MSNITKRINAKYILVLAVCFTLLGLYSLSILKNAFYYLDSPTLDISAIGTQSVQIVFTALARTETAYPTLTPIPTSSPFPSPTITPSPVIEIIQTTENVAVLPVQGTILAKLQNPVRSERDGVSMTIEQANMYTDHLDLVYTVKGIPYAETDRYRVVTNPESDPRAFPLCGGYESYPILQMPDDSLIYAASSALGGRVLTYDPLYSFYMMHSFWGTFSSDTRIFSVLLICLPDTMRGNLSENWNLTVVLTDNR